MMGARKFWAHGVTFALLLLVATTGALPRTASAQAANGGRLLPTLTLQAADVPAPRRAPVLSEEDQRILDQTRQRRELGQIHRYLGISTWAAMTVTSVLGLFQYYNQYGFGAGQNENPCATGGAIFGQEQCYGVPYPHMIGATITTALYVATFSLSLIMPDPNGASEGPGQSAERLRIHEVLRWVHLVGMICQGVMGIGLTSGWWGDRANDYGTLQTVAGIHQAIGWTTWGAMTAAAAVMTF